MRWNDIDQMSTCRGKCRAISLENTLNDKELLIEIHKEARRLLEIGFNVPIAADVIIEKLGEVVFLNNGNKFDSTKLLGLINSEGNKKNACKVIGRTIVCLMESYGLINEGPRL